MNVIIPTLLALTIATGFAGVNCSSETFAIFAGDEETFLVRGTSPRIVLDSGIAQITDETWIGEDLALVTIQCSSSSPATCTGALYGC